MSTCYVIVCATYLSDRLYHHHNKHTSNMMWYHIHILLATSMEGYKNLYIHYNLMVSSLTTCSINDQKRPYELRNCLYPRLTVSISTWSFCPLIFILTSGRFRFISSILRGLVCINRILYFWLLAAVLEMVTFNKHSHLKKKRHPRAVHWVTT